MNRQLRVAVIGAGPAGIYASDILTKSDVDVRVDIIERNPTPFGLIRYGVAPDHPRIKEIIKALRRVLSQDDIRFFGNVNYGTDLKLDDLQQRPHRMAARGRVGRRAWRRQCGPRRGPHAGQDRR